VNVIAINKHNNGRYRTKAQHWPEHGWHFQILDLDPETWGRSTSGIGTGPVIDQGFQKQLEQRGWTFTKAEPISPENAVDKVGPLPEPENVRDREMKRMAASFKPKTESRAAKIVAALLDNEEPERYLNKLGPEFARDRAYALRQTTCPRCGGIARRYGTRLGVKTFGGETLANKADYACLNCRDSFALDIPHTGPENA
jgi:hypothetical protein